MKLIYALPVALRVVDLLSPHCTRIHIAGSIRRQRPEVKDIEVVCEPKKEVKGKDLFGEGSPETNQAFIDVLQSITDHVVKGLPTGRYMQIILKGGITLDLFMPQLEDYYRQWVIRTGSADFVHHHIAGAWNKKGWCGVSGVGLRKIEDCTSKKGADGKTTWILSNPQGEVAPAWQSEEEFFDWLGVQWIPPSIREHKTVLNQFQ